MAERGRAELVRSRSHRAAADGDAEPGTARTEGKGRAGRSPACTDSNPCTSRAKRAQAKRARAARAKRARAARAARAKRAQAARAKRARAARAKRARAARAKRAQAARAKRAQAARAGQKQLRGQHVRATATLDSELVQRLQHDHRRALNRCYDRALSRDPMLQVRRIDVTVQVARSGAVARVQLSSHEDHDLGRCLSLSIQRWQFGRSRRVLTGQFPLVFRS
jgi:hypothetical protein